MKGQADWSDKEWAGYLDVSERTVRSYFRAGIIHGGARDDCGEWHAAGTGLSRYLTARNIAVHNNWECDESGSFVDPRLDSELKAAFGPLFDSRRERILRRSRMWRVASAYRRAMEQMPIEQDKLDDLQEAARWILSAPDALEKLHKLKSGRLKNYVPDNPAMKLMRSLFKAGLLEYAELLVGALSAITIDGKRLSGRLPGAYDEWRKIRGLRPTGKMIRTYRTGAPECVGLTPELKPDKSSRRQFKALMQRYGRQAILMEAKRLHPDTSDILGRYGVLRCHEGAAHWDVEAHRAMEP